MLVGRTPERRATEELLAGARVGRSGLLVISGEPGIGKTALLDEVSRSAGSMQVLRARGVESEQSVPFGGLLQVLRPVLPLIDRVPGPQARALASALLLEPPSGTDQHRFAVGAATLSLLSRAAEDRPLVVLVDDAHTLDEPSAEALVFAARRLFTDAVAMVVTVRSDTRGSTRWSSLPTLTLEGLSVAAAGELVGLATGGRVDDEQVAALHRATAGNPLGLLELGERVAGLGALPSDTPFAVSDELTRRFIGLVGELGPAGRAALLVVAADSHSASTVRRACAQLGIPPAGLAEAADAGLVTVNGDRLEFRHPLVRSAVFGSAPAAERREVHRALAAALPPHETDRIAWHVSEGAVAPDEDAALLLDEAARSASARAAFAIAARTYERAAELSLSPVLVSQRLASAGRAAFLAGDPVDAMALLDRALHTADEPALRAGIHELRGAVATRSGSLDEALSTLLHAAGDAEQTDPDTAVRLLSDAVHVCFYLSDAATALRAVGTIESLLATCHDARTRFHATMASGMALILGGAGQTGTERLREAIELVPDVDDVGFDPLRLPHQLLGPLWLRESGASRALLDGAVERLRDETAFGVLPYLLMHIARDDATTDRWQDAEAGYLEAIRLATETGQSTDLAASMAGLAWLWARQGRATECLELVQPGLELCRTKHIRIGTSWLTFAQGDLEAGRSNPAAAVAHYETLHDTLARTGVADPDLSPAAELTEAYLHLGRPEDAQVTAVRLEEMATAKGQPWSLARAHRSLGLCASDASGEVHFEAALELHRRTPDRYETARTELAYGARLRRRRQRAAARPHLRSALATFSELGARPWADKAAQELAATGETVPRRTASVIDELTPQERQISRLLVQGRTTRETAAALFISPKTVEYHLRHVYVKLGIRSRDELAEILGR